MESTIHYVFNHLELREAVVVVDRRGNRDFRRQLQSYLRKRMVLSDGAQVIRSLRTDPSHSDRLLQLADMVCGAVAKSVDDVEHGMAWRRLIQSKETRVQKWP